MINTRKSKKTRSIYQVWLITQNMYNSMRINQFRQAKSPQDFIQFQEDPRKDIKYQS